MRPIQPNYRRAWSASHWLLVFLVPLVIGGGLLGALFLLGVYPFSKGKVDDPYMVRIPISSQVIPAYEKVTREDLLNPTTGVLAFQRVPPASTVGMSLVYYNETGERIESKVARVHNENNSVVFETPDGRRIPQESALYLGGAILNINAIIGRVLKQNKTRGMAFTENLFFPQGTAAGLGGATPPGMRAITLDATKLKGIHALSAGDHVDLMASVPLDQASEFETNPSGSRLPGAALVMQANAKKSEHSATEPILLAQDALILKPVYVRSEASASSSLTQGKRIQNIPIYEVALAVKADDVLPLQNALDRELKITCVALSRQVAEVNKAPEEPVIKGPQAPVTNRPILAYEVLSPAHFQSPATRRVRFESVTQEQIDREQVITSLDQLIGTVARHDIPAGSFVSKQDLLGVKESPKSSDDGRKAQRTGVPVQFAAQSSPLGNDSTSSSSTDQTVNAGVVGQRPPITNFVPAGYTAIALPWNRLYGAEHLQIADHIDLMASYSLAREGRETETETRKDGTVIVRQRDHVDSRKTQRSWDESLGERGEPWFITSDAIVVGPLGYPPPAAAIRYLGESLYANGNAGGKNFSGPPVLIAVEDRDLETVAAALATEDVHFIAAFHTSNESQPLPAGMKQVVLAAQDLRAFDVLSEHIWQANRRHAVTRLVRLDDPVFEHALGPQELRGYFGRVLARDIPRFGFLKASDFLPELAQPGLSAGLRQGEIAVVLSDSVVDGIDRFRNDDLVALIHRGLRPEITGATVHATNFSTKVAYCVVQSARILQASHGGQTTVAIPIEDASRLQVALVQDEEEADEDRQAPLAAVARPSGEATSPGRAASKNGETISAVDPMNSLHRLDLIIGRRREVHLYENESSGP